MLSRICRLSSAIRRAWAAFWAEPEGPPIVTFHFPPDVEITDFKATWAERPIGGEKRTAQLFGTGGAKGYRFHA